MLPPGKRTRGHYSLFGIYERVNATCVRLNATCTQRSSISNFNFGMAEFDISMATVFRDYAKIKKITGVVYDKNESVWKL